MEMTTGRPRVEIWFEFASTYSYLTLARAAKVLDPTGVPYCYRVFLLGPIFAEKGLTSSPFVVDPVKGAHMWRDMERRAALYGVNFRKPALFPQNGLMAARIMRAAQDLPWAETFARAVFDAQFAQGQNIAETGVLEQALRACGVSPDDWLARAQDPENKTALRRQTERAKTIGIFGAPTFRVGTELFWGDDRLEEAIAWAQARHPLQGTS